MSSTAKQLQQFSLTCLFFLLPSLASPATLEFYVAPNGDDSNPGSKPRPFATLERARDEVRKNRRDTPAAPISVYLRGGVYLRTNSLELTQPDSGTVESPVTWQAYPGEKVALLGGRELPPTSFTAVTNPAVLSRFAPEARSHIHQVNLRSLGITDYGQMKSRGFSRPTTPSHCELFYDGKPMTLARWPNEGQFEHIAGFPENEAQDDSHRGKIGKLEAGFHYSGDRPAQWKDPRDLWVHGYWSWDWANSYEKVSDIDQQKRLLRTAPPHGNYGFRKGQRFYFLNVLEELDQPGEWFLDRETGILYFWPPAPLDQEKPSPQHSALLSLLSAPLLKLNEVSHVRFTDLVLEATRANAVEIHEGKSNLVENCIIRNIGDYGVLVSGGFGHGISRCDISDTGDGGVSLTGGDRQTLVPGGHFVQDCHFARQGRWSKCYVPAIRMTGVGLRASHNLIHDHPHCAILFSGNDHLMEFNEIHHIALETGDVGAIYTGRDYSCRGNRIRHNFIHHTGGVGMGSMGVYMDDCVSGTEIYGNIFYKVQRAVFLGGGRDHRVLNNIFVECNHAVELDGRGLDKSPVWHDMVGQFMRQRLAAVPAALYRERYPEIKSLDQYYGPPGGPAITGDAFTGVPPANNLVAKNICVGKWLHVYWHADMTMIMLQHNLTNAEPRFVRPPTDQPTALDFALQTDSPAWEIGFEKIPVEEIGPRRAKRD